MGRRKENQSQKATITCSAKISKIPSGMADNEAYPSQTLERHSKNPKRTRRRLYPLCLAQTRNQRHQYNPDGCGNQGTTSEIITIVCTRRRKVIPSAKP